MISQNNYIIFQNKNLGGFERLHPIQNIKIEDKSSLSPEELLKIQTDRFQK